MISASLPLGALRHVACSPRTISPCSFKKFRLISLSSSVLFEKNHSFCPLSLNQKSMTVFQPICPLYHSFRAIKIPNTILTKKSPGPHAWTPATFLRLHQIVLPQRVVRIVRWRSAHCNANIHSASLPAIRTPVDLHHGRWVKLPLTRRVFDVCWQISCRSCPNTWITSFRFGSTSRIQ